MPRIYLNCDLIHKFSVDLCPGMKDKFVVYFPNYCKGRDPDMEFPGGPTMPETIKIKDIGESIKEWLVNI